MHHSPPLGFGLGLRPPHYPDVFESRPAVDWFEIVSENFMDTDGRPKRNLARIKELYPVVMHGVALSIGTVDPLNSEYLKKLKSLADWLKPAWISDHLCWTGIAHRNTHDLLPVPYTDEALKHVIARIREVQDFLERPIALENPSTYLEFKSSHMPEAEFIARMAEESGCQLLLDVNNVYVTCYNHGLDPVSYIDTLPLDRVRQIHLSGHSNHGTHIIDTHDDHVADAVWALYGHTLRRAGRTPNTMIEWDDRIPEFPVLLAELEKAKCTAAEAHGQASLRDLARPRAACEDVANPGLEREQMRMQAAIIYRGEADANAWIRSTGALSAEDRLSVYANAYRCRLIDTTAEDYPVLKRYLGDERFGRLIASFVETVRSDHFNIARYAAKLPAFVAAQTDCDLFAYELCVLECAIAQLGDAPETPRLTPEHLSGLTPDTLMRSVLMPRDALRLFAFDHAVNDCFSAVSQGHDMPAPEKRATHLAMFRDDDTVWRMDLAAEEHALLERLFSGTSVGDALAQLPGTAPEKLSAWFARWMHNGLLAHKPHDLSLELAA
jgi:hypothetical protein